MNTKFWGGGGGVGVGGGMGYYNFPRSTNKIKSFDEILTSEKNYIFLHFSVVGRVKLNFRDRYGKPNLYSKNSSCYQHFSSNSQKLSLWCKKKKSLSTQMDLYDPYRSPYTISLGNFNFPWSTNKIPYFDEISTSQKKLSI